MINEVHYGGLIGANKGRTRSAHFNIVYLFADCSHHSNDPLDKGSRELMKLETERHKLIKEIEPADNALRLTQNAARVYMLTLFISFHGDDISISWHTIWRAVSRKLLATGKCS